LAENGYLIHPHPGKLIIFQCCGSGMFILDPIFSVPDPVSWIHIKEFKYFNPNNWFSALGNMIWVVHPESGSRIRIFYPSRIPDSRRKGVLSKEKRLLRQEREGN
jgi:hypothetical protein